MRARPSFHMCSPTHHNLSALWHSPLGTSPRHRLARHQRTLGASQADLWCEEVDHRRDDGGLFHRAGQNKGLRLLHVPGRAGRACARVNLPVLVLPCLCRRRACVSVLSCRGPALSCACLASRSRVPRVRACPCCHPCCCCCRAAVLVSTCLCSSHRPHPMGLLPHAKLKELMAGLQDDMRLDTKPIKVSYSAAAGTACACLPWHSQTCPVRAASTNYRCY